MATTASYIPVVGNFDAADGFAFTNAVGDPVPAASGGGFGPGRPGRNKLGLVWLINGGPVGDDASFTLKIPYPIPIQQNVLDTNFNFYLPTGSSFQVLPGSLAQEPFLNGTPNIVTQTFDFAISFASPVASPFGLALVIDFGHTITN